MKKGHILFLLFIMAFLVFAFSGHPLTTEYHTRAISDLVGFRNAIEREEIEQPAVTLPASLQIIDDEAFSGTAFQALRLPDSVERIGDKAFADNKDLLVIQFPEKTELIGDNVFAGSDKATMAVFAGSETLNQALVKGYRFFVMTAFSEKRMENPFELIPGSLSRTFVCEEKPETCVAETKTKRTGRTNAELKGELYQGNAALYVRSRYFP